MSRWIAIFFGVGLLRPAPGTWGSAAAVALGLVIFRTGSFPALLAATLLATAAGFWACGRELAGRPDADPSEIVIDEVAGQWIALLFPAFAFWIRGFEGWMPYPGWLAAFVCFRLFDIWKPWIIGWADRRPAPAGVMLDDLIAGLFAGIAVVLAAGLAHGILLR
jgi:phosphatidylglycerophosphatase A